MSNHVLDSPRRAGFHWLADAFWVANWDVTFVTTGISFASKLRRDTRLVSSHPSGVPIELAPRLAMYIEPALVHPAAIRVPWLRDVARVPMARYGQRLSDSLTAFLRAADVVVFESNASLMMFNAVRNITDAKLVYRVSDDVRVIRNSPLVRACEDAIIDRFDCVSVPSKTLLKTRFANVANAFYHPHGVPDLPPPSAERRYDDNGPVATSVGSTLLDYQFLQLAPFQRPDITFHQVGGTTPHVRAANLVMHGEVAYADAVDFAAQADVCLALYEEQPHSTYLAETSNKLALFMALRKRIIAPKFLRNSLSRQGIFYYDVSKPKTIGEALDAALAFDSAAVPAVEHITWGDVRDRLLACLALTQSP